jgi:hypothetical protein
MIRTLSDSPPVSRTFAFGQSPLKIRTFGHADQDFPSDNIRTTHPTFGQTPGQRFGQGLFGHIPPPL